jgi:uncharacterized protein DUF3604
MKSYTGLFKLPALLLLLFVASPLVAQDTGEPDKASLETAYPSKRPYSPYADRHFPDRVYWGDTHLHTSFSMDAGAFGCRLGPRDAYRFAKGQEITASSGQPVRLARPLDFLVVADHSDGFGFFPLLFSGDPKIMADPQGRRWNEMIQNGQGAAAAIDIITSFGKGAISKAIFPVPGTTAFQGAWEEVIKAAEEANNPGRFTAFIGFEWTSNTGGNNLHRNIIFRDNASKASLVEPYTTQKPLGSDNPRVRSPARNAPRIRSSRHPKPPSWDGSRPRPATPGFGPPIIRVRLCSMPCSAKKCMPPPAHDKRQ